MFPTSQRISFLPTALSIQDPSTMMQLDHKETSPMAKEKSQNGAASHTEFALFNSKRLQDDLHALGLKIKQHEDNIQFLKAQRNKLDESVLDLQVVLGKFHSSTDSKSESNDSSNHQHEEITNEQIIRHEKSAAGIFCLIETCHGTHASQLMLTKDVLGIVAKLGKIDDENLSKLLSEYLGVRTMLAVVCKTYEGVKALEICDKEGRIDKNAGLHGLGASIGRTIEGRFDVICLENIRPYAGQCIADDPQRRLEILKPRLPNGECPAGFLGFAVNMINVDCTNLLCVTSYGHGLRETLFYSLVGRLQVYKTRADMLHALPCLSDGAISLDGGMIRNTCVFSLGSCEEVNVRFAKPSTTSHIPDNYAETEKQMKELRWKKEKLQEDVKRELVLLDHAKFNFGKKKEEFVRFVAQSSSYSTQMMSPR